MNCKHENMLSLYARGEKSWISTQKLCGDMVYVCKDCGAVLEKVIKIKKLQIK